MKGEGWMVKVETSREKYMGVKYKFSRGFEGPLPPPLSGMGWVFELTSLLFVFELVEIINPFKPLALPLIAESGSALLLYVCV